MSISLDYSSAYTYQFIGYTGHKVHTPPVQNPLISNIHVGNHEASEQLIGEILAHAHREEDRARALRLRSRNKFLQRDFENAFKDTALALRELGVEIPEVVSLKQADAMFDQVKAEILALGFDHICALPRTRNPRTDLIISLMNDAATNAWWGAGPGYPEWIGVTVSPTRMRMRSHSLTPDQKTINIALRYA